MEEGLDVSTQTSIAGVFSAFVSWTSLYLILCAIWPSTKPEWHCREVTLLHAVTVVSLSAWCGFVQGPWPFTEPGGPSTWLQHLTCIVCYGYFIFDLSWCLYYKTEGAFMLVHHIISILGLTIVVGRGLNGTEMIATIFGTELTNPLLQLRWFLRQYQLHTTWYAHLLDMLFMSLFGLLRVGVASYLLYCHVQHPRPDTIAKVGGFSIYLIGWVFWVQIVLYGIRKYYKIYNKYRNTPLTNPNDKCDMNGSTSNGHVQNGHHR